MYLRQVVRQVLSFPLGKETVFLRQAVKLPRPPRQLLPCQVLTFPPGRKQLSSIPGLPGRHSPSHQGSRQAGAPLPLGKEAAQHLLQPPGQTLTLPPTGDISSQAGNNPPTSQSGCQVNRSSRQNPRHSARQRALQASQGISTSSQTGSAGTWEVNPTPNHPQ